MLKSKGSVWSEETFDYQGRKKIFDTRAFLYRTRRKLSEVEFWEEKDGSGKIIFGPVLEVPLRLYFRWVPRGMKHTSLSLKRNLR